MKKQDLQELNQQEYSDYIQRHLLQVFPEFSDYCRFETDVYIVEYPSIKNDLVLWISTQDDELTVGFDKDGECIWHTHMSLFGAYEPESELNAAVNFIKGIFEGREIIVTNSKNKIYVTDTPEITNESDDKLIFKTWKDF